MAYRDIVWLCLRKSNNGWSSGRPPRPLFLARPGNQVDSAASTSLPEEATWLLGIGLEGYIAVGAVKNDGALGDFSNWAEVSAYLGESTGGTSYAAPHLAHIAAIVWKEYPQMSAKDLESVILASAKDIAGTERDREGLVTAQAALEAARMWAR